MELKPDVEFLEDIIRFIERPEDNLRQRITNNYGSLEKFLEHLLSNRYNSPPKW